MRYTTKLENRNNFIRTRKILWIRGSSVRDRCTAQLLFTISEFDKRSIPWTKPVKCDMIIQQTELIIGQLYHAHIYNNKSVK